MLDVNVLPESVRSREIAGGVRLELSEFMPQQGNARGETRRSGHNAAHGAAPNSRASLFEIMDEIERRVICEMLERTDWNQTAAAENFQVPLSTLNQKIKRLGIDVRRRGSNRAEAAESSASAGK
jgi:DNA-binding NtrC family response regulator